MSQFLTMEQDILNLLKAGPRRDFPLAILQRYPGLSVARRDEILAELQAEGRIVKSRGQWRRKEGLVLVL